MGHWAGIWANLVTLNAEVLKSLPSWQRGQRRSSRARVAEAGAAIGVGLRVKPGAIRRRPGLEPPPDAFTGLRTTNTTKLPGPKGASAAYLRALIGQINAAGGRPRVCARCTCGSSARSKKHRQSQLVGHLAHA